MPERIEAAILMRASAERLRRIASTQTAASHELLRIATELEEKARKLEESAACMMNVDLSAIKDGVLFFLAIYGAGLSTFNLVQASTASPRRLRAM